MTLLREDCRRSRKGKKMAHPLKVFIYHHNITAKLYYYIRNFRRDCRNWMSDRRFAKWYYHKNTGRTLNLQNPSNFDEKIWYLKLYDREPLKAKCSDKLTVREYVKECGLEEILNEVVGVYDRFQDIEFQKLPDRFFIKCTHTSGCNVIYDAARPFDYDYYRHEFDYWMKRDYYWGSREWNYRGLKPKIICEQVLTDKKGNLPMDYKFFCFAGRVVILSLDIGVAELSGEHAVSYCRNIYDRDFKLLPVKESRENSPEPVRAPEHYEKMVEYAEILSRPFRHCRVDLYNLDGKIYFGELTFHHGGGCNNFQPEEFAAKLGSYIDISGLKSGK